MAPLVAEPLFGENCTTLPGVLNIAYGPCRQEQDTVVYTPSTFAPAAAELPSRPILEWLELLGLQGISEVSLSFVVPGGGGGG